MAASDPDPAPGSPKPPNLLLLITDQQRSPQHWPDEPGWLRSLTPSDHELARTGLTFKQGFCATCMCTPSRATLLTGTWPSRHGLNLTLTAADLEPDPRNTRYVLADAAGMLRRGSVPRKRLLQNLARGTTRDKKAGAEPTLSTELPTIGNRLRDAGYNVGYKGKWHLTKAIRGEWSEADADQLDREFGFADWDPPDAGENAEAEHFGGGNAGNSGLGWDEDYTRQAESWLARDELPEPFCLIVSLVNPHDVLGYPRSYLEGGYSLEAIRDMGVRLPPTVDEDLSGKPAVHQLMRMGMTAYLGPLRNERERLDYANFYAYLHNVIDEKIGRVLAALGDPSDPGSKRSRTVIVRCADHGEMGLSHGGLRQKAFNAYEETIRVPLVISNPVLFPEARETDALASLIDIVPTMLALAGVEPAERVQGEELTPIIAEHADPDRELLASVGVDLGSVVSHPAPAPSVRETVNFTFDDHQAGTATTNAPGQPNRVRAVRDARSKYAVYLDPDGTAAPEYELYDLERDPDEAHNLLDPRTGIPADKAAARLQQHLDEQLSAFIADAGRLFEG
jgi:choline-sulfatase